MQPRIRHRIKKTAPIIYRTSTNAMGEGVLVDIHESGARLILSDAMALVGTHIRVAVVVTGQTLTIDLARVCWVNGREVGIEFIRVPDALHPFITESTVLEYR